MLAAALLNYSDDFGYFNANPKLIQAACSPLREPSVSVPESLASLQAIGYARFGTGDDGKRYGQVVTFSEHQKVSHPTDSKIAKISIVWEQIVKTPECLPKIPEPLRPEGNKEGNKEGAAEMKNSGAASRTALPSVDPLVEGLRAEGIPVANAPEPIAPDPGPPMLLFLIKPSDHRAALWGPGADFVAERCEISRDRAKGIIGKWLKDSKDNAIRVFELLAECQLKEKFDPRSWVTACLQGDSTENAERKAQDDKIYRNVL